MLKQTLLTFLLAISSLPGQPIVIRGGAVLDGKGGMQRSRNILVEGSRITQVALPKGPPTYDLSRYTLMPGWIDTHVHLSGHFSPSIGQRGGNQDDRAVPGPIPTTARGRGGAGNARGDREASAEEALYTAGNAYTTLLAGFTTVQSLGAAVDVPVRDLINAEVIPGPRILTALRMIRADTGAPEQIREEIRKLKAEGADVIKVYGTQSIRTGGGTSMTDEQIQAACSEAKAVGLRSVVHAQAASGVKAAVRAGCTQVEHGSMIDDEALMLLAERQVFLIRISLCFTALRSTSHSSITTPKGWAGC